MTKAAARALVIGRIADHLCEQPRDHPLRVAVDGITAAGKTTLAVELAAAIVERGRPSIHLSMDGFHHPREHRYRQGRDSALGYYQDAYDVEAFARLVLGPLGPDGDRRYRAAVLDLATDQPVVAEPLTAPADAVLLVDGSFLQHPELVGLWDETVFVETSFDAARERGAHRDQLTFGGVESARQALDQRYHAAGRIYLADADPAASATVVIGNDDVTAPVLRRIGGPATSTVQLFSYGTLQLADVQLATFGRLLNGNPDLLPGHRLDQVAITDQDVVAVSGSAGHPIVSPSGRPDDRVAGTAFTISTTELAGADTYEVASYRRARVSLGSGVPAWVYLAR